MSGEEKRQGATVVEFYGMPAAGKTFATRRVERDCSRNGVPVDGRILQVGDLRRFTRITYKIQLIVPLVLFRPRLCYSAFSLVKASRPGSLSDFAAVFFNWLYVFGFIRRWAATDALLLMDQGVAQAVWSTAYSARREIYEDYKSFMLQSYKELKIERVLVVHVVADTETLLQRLHEREDNPSRIGVRQNGAISRAMVITEKIAKLLSGVAEGIINSRKEYICIHSVREAEIQRVRDLIES